MENNYEDFAIWIDINCEYLGTRENWTQLEHFARTTLISLDILGDDAKDIHFEEYLALFLVDSFRSSPDPVFALAVSRDLAPLLKPHPELSTRVRKEDLASCLFFKSSCFGLWPGTPAMFMVGKRREPLPP